MLRLTHWETRQRYYGSLESLGDYVEILFYDSLSWLSFSFVVSMAVPATLCGIEASELLPTRQDTNQKRLGLGLRFGVQC